MRQPSTPPQKGAVYISSRSKQQMRITVEFAVLPAQVCRDG
jgi:hypothetical protein